MKKAQHISLLMCCLLCACASFKSSQPPAALYAIHAEKAAAADESRKAALIAIPEPAVPAGLESAKIAVYLDGGRRMDYAAGASWPAPLGKMLQEFAVQSARGVPGILAVPSDAGMAAGWQLNILVNDFQPVYAAGAGGAPELRVALTFTLVSLDSDKMADSFTLARSGQAAHSLTAIVSGLEAILRGLMAEAYGRVAAKLGKKS